MKPMHGVVIGIVTAVKEGEVKVKYPWLHEDAEKESNWIRIATAMAGNDKGTFFMPELEDEVLIAFEQGSFNHPYIVGFLWNGKDKPPDKNTKKRIIKTKSGHIIEFDDNKGKEKITLKSQGDQKIELNDIPAGKITVLTKMGNSIEIDDSSGSIKISANTNLSINAPTISITGSTSISLSSPNITLGTGAFINPTAFSIQAPIVAVNASTMASITGTTTITGQTTITGATTIIGVSPILPVLAGSKLAIS